MCLRSSVVLVLLMLLVGCQKPAPPAIETHAVTGTVTFKDGSPLSGGTIQFMSVADSTLNMSATTGPDGSFTLQTVHGNQNLQGAIAGPCQVMLVYPQSGTPIPNIVTLPRPYEVRPEQNNFEIKLDLPPP